MSEGGMLTPRRISCPARCQARPCRQAVSMIQSEVRAEMEEMLTSGMKSAGDNRPRVGWRQRFGAQELAVAEPHLRLVEQLELVARNGVPELGLERQPRFDLVADRAC